MKTLNPNLMKKFLLILLLAPAFAFAQLNGTYLVGTGQAAPFDNLANAVTRIRTVGLSGPVTFSLTSDLVMTSPIVITALAGSSTANTLTIKPAETKTISISIFNPNTYTGAPAVIEMNGASNIIIDGSNTSNGTTRNLNLINNNTINYFHQTVIWIASNGTTGSNNITIKNTILKDAVKNQIGNWCLGVYSGSNTLAADNGLAIANAGAPNSNTTIANNEFVNVRQAIFINSNSATALKSANISITGNLIGSVTDAQKPSLGINMINVSGFNIQGNSLNGILNSNTADAYINAMIVDNCSDYTIKQNTIANFSHASNHMIGSAIYLKGDSNLNGSILQNTIYSIKNTGGGILRAIDVDLNNSVSTNLLIANNFISDITSTGTTTNNGNGILIRKGKDIKIYYNTIAMNSNQNNISAALCIVDGSAFNIVNNIFTNTSATGTPYGIYASVANSAFTTIDYNDYFAANIGYLGGAKTTLAAWKTATAKDANSINELPAFTSLTDLHLATSNCTIDGKGTPLTITNDIDSETRSLTKPDIGADEFNSVKCCNSTTWNGTAWSNSAPTVSVKAIINGNYTTNTADITACELQVNTGFTLTITANHFVQVQNNIAVSGYLNIQDKGSLVQVDDAATSTGNITVKRKTSRMKLYDYTYWSSPVQGQTLYQLSPNTRFDKYFSFNTLTNAYVVSTNGAGTMTPGKGYIARAPEGWSATNETQGVYEGTFSGVPNTGVIPVTIQKGIGTYNLIGNPYPSAIDIDAFITDNANKAVVNGTVLIWTHNTAISSATPGNAVYNYSADDFAKYNLTGGIKTTAAAFPGGTIPDGKIASGQSFLIEANSSLAGGTYTANFNNSMRVTGNNATFYRQNQQVVTDQNAVIEKNRLWLNISNAEGAYSEILVGYITGASNDNDNLYDGKTFASGNVLSLYSISGTDNYSIQGRALPFDDNDVVALGYKTTIAGAFTISLENVDGLFADQDVFLVDKNDNSYHNLKDGAYSFTTEIGTFDSRFELQYRNQLLGTTTQTAANSLIVSSQKNEITVTASQNIDTVEIFDLTGRSIFTKTNIDALQFELAGLTIHNQVVIARIRLKDNTTINKKVLLN